MSWSVCLQGGGEFSPGSREMDAELVRRAAGPVVVTALAGAPGREYATANANGVRHLAALGADVVGAPDVRDEPDRALAVLATARLVVLPGGSPARLLQALQSTPVAGLLRDLLAAGGAVMGASAGAMVACPFTVLPEGGRIRLAPALGLAPGLLVVPHWSGGRADWLRAAAGAPAGTQVLGIPEESGVLVEGSTLIAVGRHPTALLTAGVELTPGESWSA